MLSIGVMSSSHANYYLELAQEDYYQKGGEPPGRWEGQGASHLGLVGQVQDEAFRNVFRGFSPDGTRALTQRQNQAHRSVHRAGWDLTFSAPKSVSVAWSQATQPTRQRIEACHDKAVRVALNFLQEAAGKTRRGQGGRVIEEAKLVFACFQHGTSRAHDPQLHTHALLLNVAIRNDGTTGSVSSRSIFQHKMAAGALYRAEVAASLRRECGIEVTRTGDTFEVQGVPKRLCLEFSKRRGEILQQLEARGIQSAKGAAAVTLETRTKKETKPRDELFAEWRQVGSEHGWSTNEAESLLGRVAGPKPRPRFELADLADARGFIREREVVGKLAQELVETGYAASDIRAQAKELLDRNAVPMGNGRYFSPVVKREEPVQMLEDVDVRQEVRKLETSGFRVVAVLHTPEAAKAFEARHGVRAMTAEEFLSRAQSEDRRAGDLMKELGTSPTPKELLHRFGPDMSEAVRAALRTLESYLKREAPHIDLGIQKLMRQYGPDITQLYRFAKSKLSEPSFVAQKTVVVIPEPEKLSARDLIAVVTVADLASTKLAVIRRTQLEIEVARTQVREERPQYAADLGF